MSVWLIKGDRTQPGGRKGVLVSVPGAITKHNEREKLGKERVYFIYTILQEKPGNNAG